MLAYTASAFLPSPARKWASGRIKENGFEEEERKKKAFRSRSHPRNDRHCFFLFSTKSHRSGNDSLGWGKVECDLIATGGFRWKREITATSLFCLQKYLVENIVFPHHFQICNPISLRRQKLQEFVCECKCWKESSGSGGSQIHITQTYFESSNKCFHMRRKKESSASSSSFLSLRSDQRHFLF